VKKEEQSADHLDHFSASDDSTIETLTPSVPGDDSNDANQVESTPVDDSTEQPVVPVDDANDSNDATEQPFVPVNASTEQPDVPVDDSTEQPVVPVDDANDSNDATEQPDVPVDASTEQPVVPVDDANDSNDATEQPVVPVDDANDSNDATEQPDVPVDDSDDANQDESTPVDGDMEDLDNQDESTVLDPEDINQDEDTRVSLDELSVDDAASVDHSLQVFPEQDARSETSSPMTRKRNIEEDQILLRIQKSRYDNIAPKPTIFLDQNGQNLSLTTKQAIFQQSISSLDMTVPMVMPEERSSHPMAPKDKYVQMERLVQFADNHMGNLVTKKMVQRIYNVSEMGIEDDGQDFSEEDADYLKTMQSLLRSMESLGRTKNIGIVGQSMSGKSTLINQLLGDKVMPTTKSSNRCTFEFEYKPTNYFTLYIFNITREHILQWTQEYKEQVDRPSPGFASIKNRLSMFYHVNSDGSINFEMSKKKMMNDLGKSKPVEIFQGFLPALHKRFVPDFPWPFTHHIKITGPFSSIPPHVCIDVLPGMQDVDDESLFEFREHCRWREYESIVFICPDRLTTVGEKAIFCSLLRMYHTKEIASLALMITKIDTLIATPKWIAARLYDEIFGLQKKEMSIKQRTSIPVFFSSITKKEQWGVQDIHQDVVRTLFTEGDGRRYFTFEELQEKCGAKALHFCWNGKVTTVGSQKFQMDDGCDVFIETNNPIDQKKKVLLKVNDYYSSDHVYDNNVYVKKVDWNSLSSQDKKDRSFIVSVKPIPLSKFNPLAFQDWVRSHSPKDQALEEWKNFWHSTIEQGITTEWKQSGQTLETLELSPVNAIHGLVAYWHALPSAFHRTMLKATFPGVLFRCYRASFKSEWSLQRAFFIIAEDLAVDWLKLIDPLLEKADAYIQSRYERGSKVGQLMQKLLRMENKSLITMEVMDMIDDWLHRHVYDGLQKDINTDHQTISATLRLNELFSWLITLFTNMYNNLPHFVDKFNAAISSDLYKKSRKEMDSFFALKEDERHEIPLEYMVVCTESGVNKYHPITSPCACTKEARKNRVLMKAKAWDRMTDLMYSDI
jgi:hypothetical protein